MGSFDVLLGDERTQLDAFVEEYRSAIEADPRRPHRGAGPRPLVPSATTLLGLLKHVTWMQRVWFEECVGGTSRLELGLVQSPDESFRLADDDTVASVTAAHREACATARAAVADLPLDDVVTGHRAGPRTLRWVYLQVLRELAHHCGHADILREQVLAELSSETARRAVAPSEAKAADAHGCSRWPAHSRTAGFRAQRAGVLVSGFGIWAAGRHCSRE